LQLSVYSCQQYHNSIEGQTEVFYKLLFTLMQPQSLQERRRRRTIS